MAAHKAMRTGSLVFPMGEQMADNARAFGVQGMAEVARKQGLSLWECMVLAHGAGVLDRRVDEGEMLACFDAAQGMFELTNF